MGCFFVAVLYSDILRGLADTSCPSSNDNTNVDKCFFWGGGRGVRTIVSPIHHHLGYLVIFLTWQVNVKYWRRFDPNAL